MIDRDDLAEAMLSAASASRDGGDATPSAKQVALFGARLCRFLEDLPGDVSVAELRDLLDREGDSDEEE